VFRQHDAAKATCSDANMATGATNLAKTLIVDIERVDATVLPTKSRVVIHFDYYTSLGLRCAELFPRTGNR
jgi:hypothetical protein